MQAESAVCSVCRAGPIYSFSSTGSTHMFCLSTVSTPPKWHVIDDRTSRHEAIVNCTAFWPRFNTSNSSELILTFKIGNSKLLEPRVHYYSNNILYNISNIK